MNNEENRAYTLNGEEEESTQIEIEDETLEAVTETEDESEDDPLAHAFEYYVPEQPKKKNWPIVVLAGILVAVFVFGLLWAFDVIHLTPKKAANNPVVTSSENFEVTARMFSFAMESNYLYFQQSYGAYLSYVGLDTSVSLKEQKYNEDMTWYDYFCESTKNEITAVLSLVEQAKKNGLVLSDANKALLEEEITYYDFSSMKNGVTEQDAREYLYLRLLALQQEDALVAAMNFTDSDIEAYYQKNPHGYQICSFLQYTFKVGEDAEFATADEAKVTADKLAACKTEETFRAFLIDYLVDSDQCENEEKAATYFDSYCAIADAAYSSEDALSTWLFDAARREGEVNVTTEEDGITVTMLTKKADRSQKPVADVRHILLTADTYGSDEAAKAKADDVLATWQAGEKSASSFAALATEFSEDEGSASGGGLYENLYEGASFVEEFLNWSIDPARKAGDTGIVKTTYGYHIMYLENTEPMWRTAVVSTMQEEKLNEQYASLKKTYPVTFQDEAINALDL